jgi:type 1 glutamine amidotransferase
MAWGITANENGRFTKRSTTKGTTVLQQRVSILSLLAAAAVAGMSAGADIPPGDCEQIRLAVPSTAPARPKRPRKVLVFSRAEGYVHAAIPWGAAALRILGEKTGAYAATLSDDPAMFDRQRLFPFDAVVMNNNCGNPIADSQRRANLLEFVRSGRGLVGIHCAAHLDWPEYIEMLGGYSISHPWNEGSRVVVKLEEPGSPLLASFGRSSFEHSDEIYLFGRFSRKNVRVLLSLDADHTDMNKPGVAKDQDVPLSWIRRYGEGRVFYSALGHQKDVYVRPPILKHYLAGIQFALGDLDADAAPRSTPSQAAR